MTEVYPVYEFEECDERRPSREIPKELFERWQKAAAELEGVTEKIMEYFEH